ncbi:DUF1911 domain-containing protein [Janthinobacterium sp. HSC-3S05]|uniref:PoNe immunity protein domain-containing protein n=1 Tax=Janthinobacterium lividum TaxID=29581 RepID=UPI001CD8B7A3|nr:PoNe immunity protein domain-containing protein [Janthinobacterium lividum]MCA1859143.1 DUF1911 domain-containing protein [Janthinobacterium lividum]
MQFHEKRRQQFLSEQYFEADIQHALDISIPGLLQVLNAADSDAEDRSRVSGVIAYITCKNFFLNYTAGESIAVLRDSFISVVEAYERASRYYREYTKISDSPNFGFQEIDDFERIIQLVGLAILLHRRELIPRIHSLISNSVYDGKHAMYEELIGHDLPDRPFLDAWYHQLPYLHLLNATDEKDSEAKIAKMEQYLKVWYASMKNAGWHDSHLDVREDGGAYFGYWAIEAAAIVYLYNINDSSFRNHIVYQKTCWILPGSSINKPYLHFWYPKNCLLKAATHAPKSATGSPLLYPAVFVILNKARSCLYPWIRSMARPSGNGVVSNYRYKRTEG